MNLKELYAALNDDEEKTKSYLLGKGIAPNEMVFSAKNFSMDFEKRNNKTAHITVRLAYQVN